MSDIVIDNKASLLMKRGDVRVRLQELQDRAAKKNEITIDTITKMLANAYKIATDEKQASAAVAASMGLGKLHGLIVEKRHVETTDKTKAVREMSTDELIRIATSGRARDTETAEGTKVVN